MSNSNDLGRGAWFKAPKQYVWLLRVLLWGEQTAPCYLCRQPSVAGYTPYGIPGQMSLTLEDDAHVSAFLAHDERYRMEVTREQVWEHVSPLSSPLDSYPVCLACARQVIDACTRNWRDAGVPLFGGLVVTPGGYTAVVACAEPGRWRDPHTDRAQHAGIFVVNRPGAVDDVLLVRQVSDWAFSHDLT